MMKGLFSSLPASDDFSSQLITFENMLDEDQALQSVGPDFDPNIELCRTATLNFLDFDLIYR